MTIAQALLGVPGARVDDLSTPVAVLVPTAAWVDAARAAQAAGASRAEWLTAADLGAAMRVAVLLRGETDAILATDCAGAALPSLCGIWPGLAWHERECAEMFGIDFIGHPDPRPLLLLGCDVTAPLRRASALQARAETPWPGAVTASGASVSDGPARGRRAVGLPPGVHPAWVAAAGAAAAAALDEVAGAPASAPSRAGEANGA